MLRQGKAARAMLARMFLAGMMNENLPLDENRRGVVW